ncbi:MAG: hypothetical protein RL226_901, partial [Bacteroidota bacterium]
MASVDRKQLSDSVFNTDCVGESSATTFTVFITPQEAILCGKYADRFRAAFGEISDLSQWVTSLD